MWAAVTGPCTLIRYERSTCVESPNFPRRYDNDEQCTVEIHTGVAVPIQVSRFQTESYFDVLVVNGEPYSGSRGPHKVTPTADINWYSDFSEVRQGWRMCQVTPPAPTPPPTPCVDDDERVIALASGAGMTISGCGDVGYFCEHQRYGGTMQATCPLTCGVCAPCADDHAQIVALASLSGLTVGGCADVGSYCEHPRHGDRVRATCPVTCGSCARRLAPQADELDGLRAVAPPTPAAAAGAVERSEGLGDSGASLLYP